MGAFLDKPKTEKVNVNGSGNGLSYGLSSMQGWRIEMEDAHCAVTGLPGKLSKWSFFAVFDGHAGAKVSAVCAEQLLNTIVETEEFKKLDPDTVPSLSEVRSGIIEGFLNLDRRMRKMPEVQSGQDKSGSTAVCALISPSHVYFANCGDSRGLLIRNGRVEMATTDHKPVNPEEKDRIQKAGGSVMIQRVNGSLAVSRSLGDYDYKNVSDKGETEQLVSPEPEVFEIERQPNADEFIVLACDGIWDVMTNEDVCKFVHSRAKINSNLCQLCDHVVDTCLHKGSRDNMSIIIVAFDSKPSIDQEAVNQEKQLNSKIEQLVKEKMTQAPDTEMMDLMSFINNSVDAELLPPGGGLAAKKNTIEDFYRQYNPNYDSYE